MKKRVLPLLTAVLLLLPSCGTQAGPDLTPLDQAAAEAASFTPGTLSLIHISEPTRR